MSKSFIFWVTFIDIWRLFTVHTVHISQYSWIVREILTEKIVIKSSNCRVKKPVLAVSGSGYSFPVQDEGKIPIKIYGKKWENFLRVVTWLTFGRGRGNGDDLAVHKLTFYSDDLSPSPAEAYIKLFLKSRFILDWRIDRHLTYLPL